MLKVFAYICICEKFCGINYSYILEWIYKLSIFFQAIRINQLILLHLIFFINLIVVFLLFLLLVLVDSSNEAFFLISDFLRIICRLSSIFWLLIHGFLIVCIVNFVLGLTGFEGWGLRLVHELLRLRVWDVVLAVDESGHRVIWLFEVVLICHL